MITQIDLSGIRSYLNESQITEAVLRSKEAITSVLEGKFAEAGQLGWMNPARWQNHSEIDQILSIAKEIRNEAEVFVLIGVGGSNRGAQSVIETLGDQKVKILYAGTNLSSQDLRKNLAVLDGISVYVDDIAKDFNTLEPGIHFRYFREYLEARYGKEAAKRIIVTGSGGKGQLEELTKETGYRFLPFPADMAGRFSVLSAVGFLPMAVAGVDIRGVIDGAAKAKEELLNCSLEENPAVRYAICRNLLFDQGFAIENMVTLEPSMAYFARWWNQLYSESEGKNQNCIFPVSSNYSEDLHAVGQYIQDGKRIVIESFLDARFANPELIIEPTNINDGFDYLNGKPFDELNSAVYQAAYNAHKNGGVPCIQFHCGNIRPELFGELFYFFMLSCCVSSMVIGANPFGQNGVESYKRNMYDLLGKYK